MAPKYPASTMQKQFWLVHQLHPDDSAHHIPCVYRIRGKLDVSALEKSINEIVSGHDVFRTRFESDRGELVQIIDAERRVEVFAKTISQETEMDDLIRAEVVRPFDLTNGPLIRVRVLKLSDADCILMIIMHHIVTDLHTKELIGVELARRYKAHVSGVPVEIIVSPTRYADYAVWHRDWLDSDESRKMLSFWKKRLDGVSGFLNLPTDFSRPSVQSLKGTGVPFHLPESVTSRLKELGLNHHVNNFLVLLTAYCILLNRWSGQEDIVLGVPLTNRRKDAYKETMGCFMNILPIAVDLSDEPTFAELLQRVRFSMLEAHRNQEIPFETIINEVRPKWNPSHNPLFQAGFTFEHPMPLELEGLDVKPMDVYCQGSQLDLFAVLSESGNEIRGHFEYCTGLWNEDTIITMMDCYQTLLESVCDNPNESISRLRMLPESRFAQIKAWNDTRKVYSEPHILHHLIEKQVEKSPGNIALRYLETTLTFDELNRRSNRLARFLHSSGVGPDVPVGVFMERSVEMVVALCGILKAGGAYVPFDPEYPVQRTAFMMADTQVPFLLTQEKLVTRLPESGARVIQLASDGTMIGPPDFGDDGSSDNPNVDIMPENLAYIIYTSGSTGKPKGAMNTHQAICNRILWMQDAYGLTESDRVLQKTPFSFDVSVWEFFWPLIIGAELVMAPPESHKDSSELIRLIRENRITTVHFVPSMLRVFLENPNVHQCSGIKRVICSGEALSFDLMQKFFYCLTSELHNLYGPTEAAVDVTYWACEKNYGKNIVPIGRPVANTTIYILDKHLQPAPVGVPGELHIGGVQVARGYLNRNELTREKFIPDPFSEVPGARLYKTGDLARFLPDGNAEYLGRLDHQVKVRGFRIELGEIESILMMHPGVQNSAVLTKEYGAGDTRLAAYLVPDQQHAPTVRNALILEQEENSDFRPYVLPNGMTVSHLNENETEFMYDEIFEKRLYLKHGIEIPENACIFDIGANIGLFSVFATVNFPDATIYAFEPIPPVCRVLNKNAFLYGERIKVFQLGISDSACQKVFAYYPNATIISGNHADLKEEKEVVKSYMMGGVMSGGSGKSGVKEIYDKVIDDLLTERLSFETLTCELTTISRVIREQGIETIDLLKVDVEKSEIEALAGIGDGDWSKIGQIVIEVHGGVQQLDHVTGILKGKRYDFSVEADAAIENEKLHLVFARRPEYAAQSSSRTPLRTDRDTKPKWYCGVELIKDVKAILGEKLPEYMIPSSFTLLPTMPLTQSGKVDRRALPEPSRQRTDSAVEYVAPRNETETILAGIWCELLRLDRVGIHDNFFDIGGDSLLTAYLISQIQERFQKDVAVVKLFQYSTISALADYLQQESASEPSFEEIKKRASLKRRAVNERRKQTAGRKEYRGRK